MTPTPHGQVPEALIDLIDAYAETRYRCGGIYSAKTEAARKAVTEALSGVQALSAAPAIKPLVWSDESGPTDKIRYNHITAETALGQFSVEWKGWKEEEEDCPCVYLAGDYIGVASNLDGAKQLAEQHIRELVANLLAASPTAEQQAAPKAAPGDALDEAMRERDDAEDFIGALLDEVLGHERPEWSSSYGRADALNDVQERMTALHKPAVDKAWGQFQSAKAAPQQEAQEPSADVQAKIGSNTWDHFCDILPTLKAISRGDWYWGANTRCKYIEIRIDTRDGGCILYDSKRVRISPQQFAHQSHDLGKMDPWPAKNALGDTAPQPAPATQQAGDVVAYLDVGAGGYLDLGSELSEDALQQLPKGRHALVIAGTYGIDGYVAAPQPSPTTKPAPQQEAQEPAPSAAVFGLRLVPVEPTDQMVQAAHHIDLSYMPGQEGADRAAIYRAMIAAAPQPAVQQWNDLIGQETHADADGLLVWRDEVDFAIPTPPAEQQAAPKAAPGDAIDEAMRERDDAEDFIDALLDEVLGHERPEWSNLYGRADALNDVQERMTSLHKPAVDKAWGQFQSAMAAPQPVVREPLTCEWTHNDDDGYWDTSCGKAWGFDDGGPKENNMNFCHCCGKTLSIKGKEAVNADT